MIDADSFALTQQVSIPIIANDQIEIALIALKQKGFNAALVEGHGIFAWGNSVDSLIDRFAYFLSMFDSNRLKIILFLIDLKFSRI